MRTLRSMTNSPHRISNSGSIYSMYAYMYLSLKDMGKIRDVFFLNRLCMRNVVSSYNSLQRFYTRTHCNFGVDLRYRRDDSWDRK